MFGGAVLRVPHMIRERSPRPSLPCDILSQGLVELSVPLGRVTEHGSRASPLMANKEPTSVSAQGVTSTTDCGSLR